MPRDQVHLSRVLLSFCSNPIHPPTKRKRQKRLETLKCMFLEQKILHRLVSLLVVLVFVGRNHIIIETAQKSGEQAAARYPTQNIRYTQTRTFLLCCAVSARDEPTVSRRLPKRTAVRAYEEEGTRTECIVKILSNCRGDS